MSLAARRLNEHGTGMGFVIYGVDGMVFGPASPEDMP